MTELEGVNQKMTMWLLWLSLLSKENQDNMGAYFKLGSLNYQRLKFSILQARVLRLRVLDISSLSVYFLFFPHSFFLSFFLIVLFMPSIKSVKLILEDETSSFSGQSIRFDFSKWCENCSQKALRFAADFIVLLQVCQDAIVHLSAANWNSF